MSSSEIWLTIIGLAIVTLISRGFLLLFGARVELPRAVVSALRYAPAAALVAIVAPEIFLTNGTWSTYSSPHLWGGLAAIATFFITRGMVATIVVGMLVFTAVRWLI